MHKYHLSKRYAYVADSPDQSEKTWLCSLCGKEIPKILYGIDRCTPPFDDESPTCEERQVQQVMES